MLQEKLCFIQQSDLTMWIDTSCMKYQDTGLADTVDSFQNCPIKHFFTENFTFSVTYLFKPVGDRWMKSVVGFNYLQICIIIFRFSSRSIITLKCPTPLFTVQVKVLNGRDGLRERGRVWCFGIGRCFVFYFQFLFPV